MTRHGRNCTAGAVYTYHEKKRDARDSGFGTEQLRLGKDSFRDFDCCCLTLQPCRNPVVTPEGYLFDKEALLEYILTKKGEINKQMRAYERQLKKDENELAELAAAEQQMKVEKFVKAESDITSTPSSSRSSDFDISSPGSTNSGMSNNMSKGHGKKLPSFWIPQLTPQAKATKVEKPDKTVYCPMSGKPLRVKDLIEVKFTLVKDPTDKSSLITKKNRYMCAVTHDILGNSVPTAVIRTTGHVVTLECVEKLIKKDWLHPLTGDKLKEKDIIVLQRGGTGFATTNNQLEAKHYRPVMQA